MQETQVRSLGWEDPLEKEMSTYSSTLGWKFPCTRKLVRLQSMGSQRVGHNWATSLSQFKDFPGGSVVKNLPHNLGDIGSIPGWGRSLEKQMAIYYHILVWEIAWTEDPGRLQSMGVTKESDDLVTKQHQILKSVDKHGLRSKVSNLNEKRKILPF